MTDPTDARPPALPEPAPPLIDSRELLGEGGELRIRHQGQEYRLRRTRQGRLILTK